MSGILASVTSELAEDRPLSRDDLLAAAEDIKRKPRDPCAVGLHLVSPAARDRNGWALCANCGRAVNVLDGRPL